MMRSLLVLLLLLPGCAKKASEPGEFRSLTDSRGTEVRVPRNPRRIISLVPSTTELLFAVGAGDQIVGVTTMCLYPSEAKQKTKVGGISVNFEKILSLKPDLIVTDVSMTRKISADLEKRGFPVFSIRSENFEGIAASIRTLGDLTGHRQESDKLAAEFLRDVQAVRPVKHSPRVYFEASAEPIYSSGADSYAGDIIRRAGGRNVFSGSWKAVEWEKILHKDPDIILIAHDQKAGLKKRAGWSRLKAVRGKQVHFVPKEHFVYPTLRLLRGLQLTSQILNETNP